MRTLDNVKNKISNIIQLFEYNELPYIRNWAVNRFTDKFGIKGIISSRKFIEIGNTKEVINQSKSIFAGRQNLQLNSKCIKQKITEADKICDHLFDFLGTGEIWWGKPIKWATDIKSNHSWKPDHFARVRKNKIPKDADIKIPWELSRLQHLLVLGQAYQLIQNEKYALEYESQIKDWVDNNPVDYGVNWACTMDVAIRATNLVVSQYFFIESSGIENEFWDEFMQSLYQHMIFIRSNIEYGIIRGNHYLTDICGLVVLGLFFRSLKIGKNNLKFAINNLLKEMDYQIYGDGTDHECSIYYHAFVTELFLFTTIFLKKDGYEFPLWYLNKLQKMLEFIMYYIKPDGTSPIIGDCDDGRFIKYSHSTPVNHKHLMALGALFFNRSDFKRVAKNDIEDIAWIYGNSGINKYYEIENISESEIELSSQGFPDSGFYILRSKRVYLMVRAGDIGLRGRGGHGHCDQLGFELNIYGTDIFVDPGSYVYTGDPEMRNLFRSTQYHNTVVIDNKEQNRFDVNNLFRMNNDTKTEVVHYNFTDHVDEVLAKHHGYAKVLGVVHSRKFILNKEDDILTIIDEFAGNGNHLFEWFFHLSPCCMETSIIQGRVELIFNNCRVAMTYPEGLEIDVSYGYISKSYGHKTMAKIVHLKTSINMSEACQFIFNLTSQR